MNLVTPYLGLTLRSPFVVGASPFCDDLDLACRLADAGAGALVMRSLFAEQIDLDDRARAAPAKSEGIDFPEVADYQLSPAEYLRQIARLKRAVSIPIIASLNGHHPGGWMDFAPQLEAAGADAIELNFYQVVADPGIAADQVETEMIEMVGNARSSVRIPIAAKLSPFHASVAQVAVALELAGASGIVVFNRFYQPDVNTSDLEVQTTLRLSDPSELLVRLRWLAILSPLLRGSLAVTGGVHNISDVVKSLLTGADAIQLVSVLLRHGPGILSVFCAGLEGWMRERGYTRLDDFRGMLDLSRCRNPAAFERANYIRTLQSWKV